MQVNIIIIIGVFYSSWYADTCTVSCIVVYSINCV